MKSKSAKSAAKPHDLPILTYRLDVRCKLYGKYPTLKAATLAGLDTMWGTPWQII